MTDIIVKDIKNGSEYYYGGSAEVSAEDVSYDNSSSGAVANNLQDAMDEVFQSVSNGKTLIAAAITDKGVSTAATDSFQTMASNIGLIQTATDEQIAAYNLIRWNGTLLKTYTRNSSYTCYWLQDNLWWANDYEFIRAGYREWNSASSGYLLKYTIFKFNKDWTYTDLWEYTYRSYKWEAWYYYDAIWYIDNTNIIYCFNWSSSYNDPNHWPVPTGTGWTATYDSTVSYTAVVWVNLSDGTIVTTNLPICYDDKFSRSGGFSPMTVHRDWLYVHNSEQHVTLPYTISTTSVGSWNTYVFNITATIS